MVDRPMRFVEFSELCWVGLGALRRPRRVPAAESFRAPNL